MIAASSCSVRVRSAHNKLISLWLFVLISIYSSGCSAFGAYYEIDAETENTGWAMSILKEVKFRNRGRKIYRYSNDNVSFVVCGYQDVWKTFSVGPPLLPFIPRHYKEKTKNLVVYLTVENPGV